MSTARTLRKGILGKKLGMTQIFTDDGYAVPVTVVMAGPCLVVGQRTTEKDGYLAVQLAWAMPARSATRTSPTSIGRPRPRSPSAASGRSVSCARCVSPRRIWKRTRRASRSISRRSSRRAISSTSRAPQGQRLSGRHEAAPDAGLPRDARNARVLPSRRLDRLPPDARTCSQGQAHAGPMGDERKTIQNLVVMEIDAAQNLLLLRGAIPGASGGYVVVRGSKKRWVRPGSRGRKCRKSRRRTR